MGRKIYIYIFLTHTYISVLYIVFYFSHSDTHIYIPFVRGKIKHFMLSSNHAQFVNYLNLTYLFCIVIKYYVIHATRDHRARIFALIQLLFSLLFLLHYILSFLCGFKMNIFQNLHRAAMNVNAYKYIYNYINYV